MAATCFIISEELPTLVACFSRSFTMTATALSIPFLNSIGLAPAATFLRPSFTMACANTVAVVVPSPAISLVLVAASFSSWAPMFSYGSSSSISLATVTPSWVMVGAPHFLSNATLRPLGPSVDPTALANVSTPFFRERRASSENLSCFAMVYILPLLANDGENIALAQNQNLAVAPELDIRAAVL